MTLVPTRMYFKDGRVKVEIAVARGKELHDKRRDIADAGREAPDRRELEARGSCRSAGSRSSCVHNHDTGGRPWLIPSSTPRSARPTPTRPARSSPAFGWTYSDGAFPGYTFVDTGVEGAIPTAISPLQGDSDAVLFFVGVEDVEATLAPPGGARRTISSRRQQVPGVTFGVFATAGAPRGSGRELIAATIRDETNIRGRPGFDVVDPPDELQAEVAGWPRKSTGNNANANK